MLPLSGQMTQAVHQAHTITHKQEQSAAVQGGQVGRGRSKKGVKDNIKKEGREGVGKMVYLEMMTLVLRKVTLLLRTVMVYIMMMKRQVLGKMYNCLVPP